ncbi:MAG: RodZ domain-containing protein [Candidatus Omnitrophota bacterium]
MQIGEKLKKARLEKNISLDEVFKQTKIHPRVLAALEENQAEEQLSLIYIKSFIKSYAQYLGLDARALLDEYSCNSAKKGSGGEGALAQPKPPVQDKKINTVSGVSAQDNRQAFVGQSTVLGGRPTPAVNADKYRVTLSDSKHLPGLKATSSSDGAKLFPVSKAVLIIIAAVAMVFSFNIVLKNKKHGQQTAARQPKGIGWGIPKKPALPTGRQASPAGEKLQDLILEVKAKDACWIQVEADKQLIFQNTLVKGAGERWRAEETLELRIGKPEALEIVFNGRPVDLKKIQVKKALIVTREGIFGK